MALTPINVHSDISIPADQLDGWADVYFEAKTAGLMQIPLSVFLNDPLRHLAEGKLTSEVESADDEFLPLLPRQAEVAARIQEQWDREDALEEALKAPHLTPVHNSAH
ncbi:hypothetical protein SA496_15270 [Pseudomonas sp. JS3066]|uniref:hypothetical protein n=1 Tax=Pseudomonas sp. JS3066 TaxID=3090665 RepID=UPI002E7B36E1|nr:hypothetical protein [Pseudomonas sp. JS3066]WVK91094.1 hypothetical protein SA496_15270 [Pseudomonas sp. JS3066]